MHRVSLRYMQSLANNLSFTRYKEVYSAAAEIVGLILKGMAERDEVGSVSVTLVLLFGSLFSFYKLPKKTKNKAVPLNLHNVRLRSY